MFSHVLWVALIPSIRHNEIRDLTANIMAEVCHNVLIDQPSSPSQERHSVLCPQTRKMARSDIAADDDFWGGQFEHFLMSEFSTPMPFQPHTHTL